ncbi:AI-2E family transporter [Sanguibacter antarcticus]|uniref:Putative PurR-regulated permease PerM n=1 Tax=Sanguibacter antarcticus TaxID=372484 RepID=A0A2A9E585_9MICO|nr:AI-2E family transporter [Sanguibacter antarcticus]PFG33330.1 putative PurR-regulated permease PerM [Sanguibacter antarcticus]
MAAQRVRSSAVRRNTGAIRPPVLPAPDPVPGWLRTTAAWSWRLLLVTAAILVIFMATARVQIVFVALFVALVFTAVLRPLVIVLSRVMPRGLATALGMLAGLLVVGGLVTYVVASVAGQWQSLSDQFASGTDQIFQFFEDGPLPFTITTDDYHGWVQEGQDWVQQHAGDIAGTAFEQVGTVVKVFSTIALAIFCTVFLLARGENMWTWFLNQLPANARQAWKVAGGAGWYTFSGYTRGTVIVAVSDGFLAGLLLTILGVPLAVPLAVLVFLGGFIPLIGAPLAMVIAMVVALAADGIVTAAIVGIGIALIGQFEGHVLQPLVMGKQVSLHPMVVALVVTGGTLLAGILGAVIAVPLVAVAWAVFSKLHHPDPPMETIGGDDELCAPSGDPASDDDKPEEI